MTIVKKGIHSYSTDSPRQVIQHYQLQVPDSNGQTITPMVFIHGGAWVDPTNTYSDFDVLVDKIDKLITSKYEGEGRTQEFNLFSLDYRLSPEVKHPDHLLDILKSLNHIKAEMKVDKVTVIGHSVGATLCSQIISYKQITASIYGDDYLIENVSIPEIENIVFLDGIYNVKEMLVKHPDYQSFVTASFRKKIDWEEKLNDIKFDLAQYDIDRLKVKFEQDFKRTIVLHSLSDELLPIDGQPVLVKKWFDEVIKVKEGSVEYILGEFGKHNDVYISDGLAEFLVSRFIS